MRSRNRETASFSWAGCMPSDCAKGIFSSGTDSPSVRRAMCAGDKEVGELFMTQKRTNEMNASIAPTPIVVAVFVIIANIAVPTIEVELVELERTIVDLASETIVGQYVAMNSGVQIAIAGEI